MIGLGSNRLTVCRRGGMSVTQAGRGGMEWLAGARMPNWASPYSAQATAALKAQFPTQWPTIRDYGFAHPALVPFINEDPMLVMSLIEGLGTRTLALVNTPIYLGLYFPKGFRCVGKMSLSSHPNNNYGNLIGWKKSAPNVSGHQYRMYLQANYGGQTQLQYGFDSLYQAINYTYGSIISVDMSIIIGQGYLDIDGVRRITSSNTFPALNDDSKVECAIGDSITTTGFHSVLDIYNEDGDLVGEFAPFIRSGACGMINLLDGTFHAQAVSSGTATISETPAS